MGAARDNGGAVLGLGVAVAVTVALLACRCAAQTPSASSTTTGGSGCMPELVSLSPCMGFMSGSATAPAAACCSALSGVLRSNPGCLCMVLGGTAASLGVAVDTARAVLLPGACSIQAPSASQCNALEAPMPSPASPAPPVATPATPTEPSGTPGSKTTPTPFTHYSDGSMMNPRMMFIVVVVVIVALLDHL